MYHLVYAVDELILIETVAVALDLLVDLIGIIQKAEHLCIASGTKLQTECIADSNSSTCLIDVKDIYKMYRKTQMNKDG